ncbi:MAG TPA: hypothetical protein VHE30_16575 [Polyangiaceae bacterium]|nr:hypothetical protein [Polyangiaceae bacterium]
MSTVGSTRELSWALAGALVVFTACKRSPSADAPPSASAPAPAAASVPSTPRPRCRALADHGFSATLGDRTTPDTGDGGADEEVALPFSPEIGGGVALGSAFVVAATLPDKKGATAAAVVLSPGASASRTIDLGKVHGDVPPPRLAAAGEVLFAVVSDGAPHGSLARLARIEDAQNAPRVSWGAEVPQASDDSEALALEAGPSAVVLAWDEFDAKGERGVIRIVSMAPGDPKHAAPPLTVQTEDDAEAPAVVRRAGGFWAAFLGRDARAAGDHAAVAPAPSGDPGDPGETLPTWVDVLPLDDAGKPAGAPRRVTPKEGHAQSFDLAPLPNGDALVAYRDDRSVPGTSGGVVRLVTVHSSGSTDVRTVADEDLGPGVPTLLADTEPSRPTWLAFPSDGGVARFLALDAEGRNRDTLGPETAIGTATLLAARGGRLLATRPHGKGVEALVFACDPGRADAPAASSASP